MLKGIKEADSPVMFDRSGYLKVFSANGEEIWKSSEEFGGSETSFKLTDRSNDSGFHQVFFDQRIIITANGAILVPKNSASWFMLGRHSYSKNSLYSFAWDGTNLEEKWHTRLSDFYL
jgi:hypothetical protein